MLRKRVIPILQLNDEKLVKSIKFKNHNSIFASRHNICIPIGPYIRKNDQNKIISIFEKNLKHIRF